MKVLCYGVRETERPLFETVNEQFHFELTLTPLYLQDEESLLLAQGHDAVLLRGNCRADAPTIDRFHNWGIRYLLTRTAGTDHIDIDYAKKKGMILGYVPFYSPNAIAELALTHAMMLLRHMAWTVQKTSQRDFTIDAFMFSKEVRNCKVGIIGMGRIGQVTAALFKGLGATILGYDAFPKEGLEDLCTMVSFEELLAQSDIISLHAPYIPSIGRLIGADEIEQMKKGAILINAARGELLDLEAALDAIEKEHLGGLGLDTMEGESGIFFKRHENALPPAWERAISLYPRVLISPHMGSYTDEAVRNMIEVSFQNLQHAIKMGSAIHPL